MTTLRAPGSSARPDTTPRAGSRPLGVALVRRWPTWLALALAAVSLTDWDGGLELVIVLPVAAVGYLTMAVLDRPAATWAVVVVLLGCVALVRAAGIDPWPVLLVAGGLLLITGLVRGQLRRPGLHALQPPVALLLVGIALAAHSVAPDLARHLVGAALIGHAAWDLVHWRADRIVSRSFAEWCGVFDLVLGTAVLVLA